MKLRSIAINHRMSAPGEDIPGYTLIAMFQPFPGCDVDSIRYGMVDCETWEEVMQWIGLHPVGSEFNEVMH